MNVMHDACHGSFSERRWINTLTGLTMNALGSNAFLWKIKHNIIHHTYTNIATVDSDIENWPLLRQTPVQKSFRMHRYQHLYMFILYAVSTLHWMLVFDFEKYFTRRFASTPIRKISLTEHLIFWISKLLYVTFYIAIPTILLGWTAWLIGFIIVHITMGIVLITIFQLAHLVEKTRFENGECGKSIDYEWAIHELRTTADFATGNKILNWYLGGLNFQVEHHLFPRVCHIHYPQINKIVKRQCIRFGIIYNSYPTLREAILSHVRLMRKLGQNQLDTP
jgi:linoleoyl-CoA desaturase